MKAHDLAKALLAAPNVPVVINGWQSDEGFTFEVTEVSPLATCCYSAVGDTKDTPRDKMGYQEPRECVALYHGQHTPPSTKQDEEREARRLKACELKRTNPDLYHRIYAELITITPDELLKMVAKELPKQKAP